MLYSICTPGEQQVRVRRSRAGVRRTWPGTRRWSSWAGRWPSRPSRWLLLPLLEGFERLTRARRRGVLGEVRRPAGSPFCLEVHVEKVRLCPLGQNRMCIVYYNKYLTRWLLLGEGGNTLLVLKRNIGRWRKMRRPWRRQGREEQRGRSWGDRGWHAGQQGAGQGAGQQRVGGRHAGQEGGRSGAWGGLECWACQGPGVQSQQPHHRQGTQTKYIHYPGTWIPEGYSCAKTPWARARWIFEAETRVFGTWRGGSGTKPEKSVNKE